MSTFRFASILALGAAIVFASAPVRADVLYQFTTPDAALTPDDGYDPSIVTITAAPNVTAPANGTALAASNVGIDHFWNTEFAGFTMSSANGPALDSTKFGTGYFQLTLSGANGAKLNLVNLALGSARGGGDPATQTRGFKLYAAPNGQAFNFSDTPVLDVPNETGTRSTPVARTADLSAPAFQNIDSVTFRYYPLTPAAGNSMDFTGWTINGTTSGATPEPTSASIALLGLAATTSRRRRRR
jgi:MYXO-CTERM domain-containing protein